MSHIQDHTNRISRDAVLSVIQAYHKAMSETRRRGYHGAGLSLS